MHSDFELSCKSARDAIDVPAFPLGAIRQAVHDRPDRKPVRRRAAVAAIAAGLSIVAAAAAAEIFGGVQVSLDPSGAARLNFDGKTSGYHGPVRDPKETDFHAAARAMNFPVVFPKGLPMGTHAEGLMVLGPGAMEIVYDLPGASRRSNHLLFVILANPRSVVPRGAPPPHTKYSIQFGPTAGIGAVRWSVGQEEVLVLKSRMTRSELARFKAAMTARSYGG